jgi:hypothetical protein
MARWRKTGGGFLKMEKHVLDTAEIDEVDEIDGEQQLVLVWCDTHQVYEWHWVDRKRISR